MKLELAEDLAEPPHDYASDQALHPPGNDGARRGHGVTGTHPRPSAQLQQQTTSVSSGSRNGGQHARQSGVPGATREVREHGPSQYDLGVVGTEFTVSPSIREECARDPGELCTEIERVLHLLAEEPRDVTWAGEMEAVIAEFALESAPDGLRIRKLECRTTWCAMETESTQELLPGMSYELMRRHDLYEWVGQFTRENTQHGRVSVQLMTFERDEGRASSPLGTRHN